LIAELTRMAATPVPKPTVYPMAGAAPAGPAPVLADASMQQGAVAGDKPAACIDDATRARAKAAASGRKVAARPAPPIDDCRRK
jgi:hypothetical protein